MTIYTQSYKSKINEINLNYTSIVPSFTRKAFSGSSPYLYKYPLYGISIKEKSQQNLIIASNEFPGKI